MAYIVCEKSTVLTFISGCLLYKQEIVFFLSFSDIQKRKCGRARGREIQGILWEWSKLRVKSEGLWGKGRQWGKYWDQIFPWCAAGLNTFWPCCVFELVSERHSLKHYPLAPPKAIWQCFQRSSSFQNPRLPSSLLPLPLCEHLHVESIIVKWGGTERVAARHVCPDRESNMVSAPCTVTVLSYSM